MKPIIKNYFIKSTGALFAPKFKEDNSSKKKPIFIPDVTVVTLTGVMDNIVSKPALEASRLVVKPVHDMFTNFKISYKPPFSKSAYMKLIHDVDPSIREFKTNSPSVAPLIDLSPLLSYEFSGTGEYNKLAKSIAQTMIATINDLMTESDDDVFLMVPVPVLNKTKDEFVKAVINPDQDKYRIESFEEGIYIEFVRHCCGLPSVFNYMSDDKLARLSFLFSSMKGDVLVPGIVNKMLRGETKEVRHLSGKYFKGYVPKSKKLDRKYIINGLFGLTGIFTDDDAESSLVDHEELHGLKDSNMDISGSMLTKEEQLREEREKKEAKIRETSVKSSLAIVDISKKFTAKSKRPPKDIAAKLSKQKHTPAKAKRIEKLLKKKDKVKVPGTDIPVTKAKLKHTKVKPHVIKVTSDYANPQYEKDTLHGLDSTYLTKGGLETHIAQVFASLNNAGFIVTDIKKEVKEDITGSATIYRVKVNPVDGKESTLVIPIPTIDKHGLMKYQGTVYYMKRQKADKPISKISATEVMIASAAAKISVTRDNRVSNNTDKAIARRLISYSESPNYDIKVVTIPAYKGGVKIPKLLSGLGLSFTTIISKRLQIEVNLKDVKVFDKAGKDFYLAGKYKGNPLLINIKDDKTYVYKSGKVVVEKPLIELLGLLVRKTKNPKGELIEVYSPLTRDTAVIRLNSIKRAPVGLVLAQMIGLTELIKTLKCKVDLFNITKLSEVKSNHPNDLIIPFKDVGVRIIEPSYKQSLIMNGFTKYSENTKDLKYSLFDEQGRDNTAVGYVLSNASIPTTYRASSAQFVNEVMMLFDMFVDPITKAKLEQMKEPTDIEDLLIKGVKYLTDDTYPVKMDMRNMVIKGYDRIAEIIYHRLYRLIYSFRNLNRKNAKLTLGEYEVWAAITTDETIEPYSVANPIDGIKQKSAITYIGSGGRSTKTLVQDSRKYTPGDVGILSGSTIDSGKVGILAHASAAPRITDVYGNTSSLKDIRDDPAAAFSVTDLMSPLMEFDDPKRQGFANIHDSHMVGNENGDSAFIRGGYEPYLARRPHADNTFSIPSEGNGVVIKVTKEKIVVQYKDQKEPTSYSLYTKVGSAAGKHYPHTISPLVKEGEKVNSATLLGINKAFYGKSKWESDVTATSAVLANIALFDVKATWEDASTISENLAKKLQVSMVKREVIRFNETNELSLVKTKIGSVVKPDDAFMLITPELIGTEGMSKEALTVIKAQATDKPLSSYSGEIVNLEVYYNAEYEDMHPSVLKLVKYIETQRAKRRKADGKNPLKGKVTDSFKMKGQVMNPGDIAVVVDIKTNERVEGGDKVEYGYMFKSVVADTFPNNYRTKDGHPIDGMMAYKGIMGRITASPFLLLAGSMLERIGVQLTDLLEK